MAAGKYGTQNRATDTIFLAQINGKKCVLTIKRGQDKTDGKEKLPATPGGVVEPGDDPMTTRRKEFLEEVGGKFHKDPKVLEKNKQVFASISEDPARTIKTYEGLSGDPRDTNNAWFETTAFTTVLTEEEALALRPVAGDDAAAVDWMPIEEFVGQQTFAAHNEIVLTSMFDEAVMTQWVKLYPESAEKHMTDYKAFAEQAGKLKIVKQGDK